MEQEGKPAAAAGGHAHAAAAPVCSCCPYNRNQRKKAALAFTKDAYNKLQAENGVLLQQLEESTRESYQVSEHFRQELLAKNQKIADLQSQLEQVRHHSDAQDVCAEPPACPPSTRCRTVVHQQLVHPSSPGAVLAGLCQAARGLLGCRPLAKARLGPTRPAACCAQCAAARVYL